MIVASHILAATNFSDTSARAVTVAGELARRLNSKLTLLSIHGYPPEPPEAYVPHERLYLKGDMDADSMDRLEMLRSDEFSDLEGVVLAVAMDGHPSHAIYDYATKHMVDLIVIGSHKRTGLAHFFRGGIAEQVVKHAPCPVHIVPYCETDSSGEVMGENLVVHQGTPG